MKHILYGMGVLPSPHKKGLYNHLSFIDGRVWTVVRGWLAHGSPALHMLCFLTLKLRLSQTISKHDKTVSFAAPSSPHSVPLSTSILYPQRVLIFLVSVSLFDANLSWRWDYGWQEGVMEKMKEQIKRQTLTCFWYRKTHSMSKLQVCFKPATSFFTHTPTA